MVEGQRQDFLVLVRGFISRLTRSARAGELVLDVIAATGAASTYIAAPEAANVPPVACCSAAPIVHQPAFSHLSGLLCFLSSQSEWLATGGNTAVPKV